MTSSTISARELQQRKRHLRPWRGRKACPRPDKVVFHRRESAIKFIAIREIEGRPRPARPYHCVCGKWHTTSKGEPVDVRAQVEELLHTGYNKETRRQRKIERKRLQRQWHTPVDMEAYTPNPFLQGPVLLTDSRQRMIAIAWTLIGMMTRQEFTLCSPSAELERTEELMAELAEYLELEGSELGRYLNANPAKRFTRVLALPAAERAEAMLRWEPGYLHAVLNAILMLERVAEHAEELPGLPKPTDRAQGIFRIEADTPDQAREKLVRGAWMVLGCYSRIFAVPTSPAAPARGAAKSFDEDVARLFEGMEMMGRGLLFLGKPLDKRLGYAAAPLLLELCELDEVRRRAILPDAEKLIRQSIAFALGREVASL